MSFESAFGKTIILEGGDRYVNDPDDPGGPTKFGLSKAANPDLDIENLTLEDAKRVYLERYWIPLKLDRVENDQVQEEIFDTAVNIGRHGVSVIVQEAINFLEWGDLNGGVEIDGIIGPVTLAHVNRWCWQDPEAFFKVLNGYQFIVYVNDAKNRPRKRKYIRGWMKRIQGYRRPT